MIELLFWPKFCKPVMQDKSHLFSLRFPFKSSSWHWIHYFGSLMHLWCVGNIIFMMYSESVVTFFPRVLLFYCKLKCGHRLIWIFSRNKISWLTTRPQIGVSLTQMIWLVESIAWFFNFRVHAIWTMLIFNWNILTCYQLYKFLFKQADHLRQETLQQMSRILTTRQAARGLLALGEYFQRLRALSSIWATRPREPA